MTGTFARVEKTLIALLGDKDNKVIALTGAWGTGKTYLWQKVQNELFGQIKDSEKPIYVSLFGAKAIVELKLRIFQQNGIVLTDVNKSNQKTNAVASAVALAIKNFTGVSSENIALILLPPLIKNRLIVIDDIERKHKSLDIDELLGMLDEYSEIHDTRFLILLNTDKLDDASMWATLHEKVIDAEVVLNPTANETFAIAAQGNTKHYLENVRVAIEDLNIRNIRVIQRILKTTEFIANEMQSSTDIESARWIPSTVLLTAIHYHAAENAPSFAYLKSFNPYAYLLGDKSKEKRDPKEVDCEILLKKLGIHGIDAYEEIVYQYLQSGLLDTEKLTTLFEQYRQEQQNSTASNAKSSFLSAYYWDAHKGNVELLEMAKNLLPTISQLSAEDVSEVVPIVEELGDIQLARQMLDICLQSLSARFAEKILDERFNEFATGKFHPEILAKLTVIKEQQHPRLSLIEARSRITKNSGWGEREKVALGSSTVQEYVRALKQITGTELSNFVREHCVWLRQENAYDENFENARGNFLAACLQIYNTESDSRLAKIIARTFDYHGLLEKLEPPTT